ncbi:MAG TPA: hypothetical protein VK982_06610 [Bacteroidales bacterium]|nr:hypothetical protein [Bacteroidales bacterium]
MIKNKKAVIPFLLLAWAIIFAHSIIPHHHHDPDHDFVCNHCHANHHNTFTEEINDYDDCDDHACHFQIEVLRQVSIDPVFIATSEHLFSVFFPNQKSERNTFYIEIRYEPLFFTNQLRAPPIFI